MPLNPPTAATKFQPPTPVVSWVERERLTQLLAAGNNRRLALIHGPAGYGKSTVAAQWLARRAAEGNATAWFSLDRDDNNTVWFLSHLLEALLPVHSGLDHRLLQLLEERPDDAERFVIPSIINAVDGGDRPTVIALDDWHLIGNPRTRAVLERLLDDGGDNHRFVITSRTRNGLPLGRLRVRDQLVEVDTTSLRFDEQESRQFLVGLNGLDLTTGDLAALHESTDGWVAALQLTSLSLRGQDDVSGLIRKMSGTDQAIGEYLAENVLDTLEPELLDFLLATSIPERICADLASTLSGMRLGQAMLEQIQARDLFLLPLDVEGGWYRYHHLFADYLRRRLERDAPERVTGLHNVAAHWYADNGYASEAVDHALTSNDLGFAIEVVESNAMLLVEHSRMSTLLALVEKIPGHSILTRPRLQMAIAWANCLMHFPQESHLALERTEVALDHGSDLTTGAREELQIEALVVRRCLDMYADKLDTSGELESKVLSAPERLRPWIVSVAANISTYSKLHSGEFDEAINQQEWARPIHDQTAGPFSGVYGRCFAGLAAYAKLEMGLAERYLTEALELGRRSAGAQSHAARLAGGLLGELFYQKGNLTEAEILLNEARELGPHGGVVDFMMSTYSTLARISAARDDLPDAERSIKAGETIGTELRLPRLTLRLMGDRARLRMPWHPYKEDCHLDPHVQSILRMTTKTASLESLMGKLSSAGATETDHAVRQARDLLAEAEHSMSRYAMLQAQLTLATVLQISRRHAEAKSALIPALITCWQQNLLRPVIDAGCLDLVRALSADLAAGGCPPATITAPDDFQNFLTRILDNNAGQATPPPAPILPSPGLPSASLASLESSPAPATAGPPPTLSKRELEILILIEQGLSNREVAVRLHIGINTVKWYLKSLFNTFRVTSRQQCVDAARSLQLLDA